MNINTPAWNRMRYDLYAPFYDPIGRLLTRGRRQSLALVALRPGERVLIVGAGTGLDLPLLPRGVHVTLVDISPGMLRRAEARAEHLQMPVESHLMDAARLTFASGSFDCLLLHAIVAVAPEPVACLSEARRVLAPGGRIGIFDKFLPDERVAGLLRQSIGAVTHVLFSNINRRLGPLSRAAGLRIVKEEPPVFLGLFKAALAVPYTADVPFARPSGASIASGAA